MKNNFAKKIFKISTAVIFGVFVLTLVGSYSVKASHIQYQYDDSLSIEENYKKAGHEEDYLGFKQTMLDKNKDSDKKNEEVTSYVEGFVPDWLKDDIESTIKEKNDVTDEYIKKVNDLLESEPKYIIKDGKYQGDSGKFTYTLLQSLPQEGPDLKENVTLKEYLTWAFRFALALAGFLAVMMIVIGGVEYIISGANESSRSDAKKRINNAISGLVLALVSYLVLYTINPSLVDFKNNQFFKKKTTTSSSDGTFNGGGGGEFRGGGSSSSVATNVKDLQFDFSSSSDNTGGASGTW